MREETNTNRAAKPNINPYLVGILMGFMLFMAFFQTGSDLDAIRILLVGTGVASGLAWMG
ncbi:MAG: hypothetical protein KAS38_13180 [Anaerolineales bacterium]|nr:hypothetical protein [Anaerolineales bacterium]